MTDRSSEERSRFEKWWTAELLSGKTWTSADIDNMQLAWRAALEDRQEAAPDDCARYRHALEVIGECSKDGKSVNVAVLALYPPGVPSEATPSKENAPTLRIDKLIKRAYDTRGETMMVSADEMNFILDYYGGKPAAPMSIRFSGKKLKVAPTPEVQGTPKIDPNWPWTAEQIAAESAPVGTPQKETPPISEQVAVWRNLYPSAEFASVTAAVQGKEPQTFEQFWKVEKEALLARVVCRCSAGSTCDSSAVHVDKFAKEVFVSGEAAGRRSAITERIAVLKEAAAAQCDFCGGRFTYDKAPRTEPEHIERVYVCNYGEVQGWAHGGGYVEYLPCDAGRIWKAIAKCAELQEKTKP